MESIASGPVVTIIGISTVFVALAMLIGVLNVMRRILQVNDVTTAPVTAATSVKVAPASNDDDLLRVALAAYGLHQRRRVSVRQPQPTASVWAMAGRSQELRRMERRQ